MSDFYTSIDVHRGKILFRGYEDGIRVKKRVNYKPYLFLPDPKKQSPYKTIDNKPVAKMEFDSLYAAREFVKKYEDVEGFNLYGSTTFQYVYLYDKYRGHMEYDNRLIRRCYLDVETMSDDGFPDIETANKEITLITVKTITNLYITFGWCKDYSAVGRTNVAGIKHKYLKYKTENDMLIAFLKWWGDERFTPDILSGWNIQLFDLPYMVNRIRRLLGEEEASKLSPWLVMHERMVQIGPRFSKVYDPVGIAILDYLELYKKFTYNQRESYRLDHIAQVELGKGKLDYSEFGSLHEFFVQDYDSFVDYNILDVVRVSELEDKMHLIDLALAMAYDAGVNYQDVLGTVKVWDTIIHNYLMDRNIVVNQNVKDDRSATIAGGYVKDPHVGMHRWVASFDLTSLYPHLIMQYNISPETYAGMIRIPDIDKIIADEGLDADLLAKLRNNDLCVAANGATYRRNVEGFLGVLMKDQFSKRKAAQNEMKRLEKEEQTYAVKAEITKYDLIQMAKKIQINSLYGALANKYFRWYSVTNAEAITLSGQLAIKWIAKKINTHLNGLVKNVTPKDYVIASDTDSVYLNLADFCDDDERALDQIDDFCEQLNELIDEWYSELAVHMNAYTNAMKMKREIIADKAIWIAKKRYIANMVDKEGTRYDKPKLKIMGIEAVRSSTPSSCREAIKDTLKIIMTTDELTVQKHIEAFRQHFKTLPFDAIASPRGVNGMVKYQDGVAGYKLGTPIHVRGALLYNTLLQTKGLDTKYQKIIDKDKIKFCYLKHPNPLFCHVISCPDKLPPEFKIQNYIDYDAQFETVYLEPISKILSAIGWHAVKRATLEAFIE